MSRSHGARDFKFAETNSATSEPSPLVASDLHQSWGTASLSLQEVFAKVLLRLASAVSILTTVGIVLVLFSQAWGFFDHISPADFFFGTQWNPLIEPKSFGVLPLIWGTLMIGIGSTLIAGPIGLGCALYLSEYVKGRRKQVLKSIIEILAGIPSVVYGFFAFTTVTPVIRIFAPETPFFNALSASIVVGIMIIPTIASISQDAFGSVPQDLREAGYGLGARKFQVSLFVVFPAALSGVIASFVLGFSRAIGETMAVTLAAGATPNLTWNILESIQTMTAYIIQISLGDTPSGTVEYQSLYAVGLLLLALTFLMNIIAKLIIGKFQERYL